MAPATEALGELLSHRGLQACRRDYERAVTSVASDRAQAIASASSALESICQAILSRLGQPVPKDVSIQNLIDKTMQALHLAPEAEAAGQIKRIFAAVRDIAAGVAVLRTKYGSAHGRNDDHTPLAPVHARLAINAMAAIGMFLLESVLDGPEDQSPGSSPSRT